MSHSESSLQATIEQLVRDALAQVAGASQGSTADAAPAQPTSHDAASSAFANSAVLRDRLITLQSLESLPASVSELRVGLKAIVTPAVLDELKRRKLTLTRVDIARVDSAQVNAVNEQPAMAATATGPSASHQYVLTSHDAVRDAALVRQLALRGVAAELLELEKFDGLPQGAVAVMASELPAMDVDRLGRGEGLVAVAIDHLDLIQRVTAAMTPQVWVLDTQRLTFSGLVTMAVRCLRAASVDSTPAGRKPR
ncbi:MAG: hypothetical protein KDB23_32395 [Planctomycetales bacterium]|nr:hypothetical protein [Planctomycetales bacterium]